MRAPIPLLLALALLPGCLSPMALPSIALPHSAAAGLASLASPIPTASPSNQVKFQLDTLASKASFTLHVDHVQEVQLGIDFDQAASDDVALDGPGNCANRDLGAVATQGATGHPHWSFGCGIVFPGNYTVTVSLDVGIADGSLQALGGRFL